MISYFYDRKSACLFVCTLSTSFGLMAVQDDKRLEGQRVENALDSKRDQMKRDEEQQVQDAIDDSKREQKRVEDQLIQRKIGDRKQEDRRLERKRQDQNVRN